MRQLWAPELEKLNGGYGTQVWSVLVKGTHKLQPVLESCRAEGKVMSSEVWNKGQIHTKIGKGEFVSHSIWWACLWARFWRIMGKARSLCWHVLFGLAVRVTFWDLSISTSRGCIFSQGRHFYLEKPVWTINSKCTLRELVSSKLSAISLKNEVLNM